MPRAHASNDHRLFVAIYPPPDVARRLLRAVREASDTPGRDTSAEQVHITAHFIGDVRSNDLESVLASVERSTRGLDSFELTPLRLITLPARGRPRLIAAETDAPPVLLELHARLVRRLARGSRARPSDRFLPHMTLRRFSHAASPGRVDVPLNLPAFGVEEICVVRSVLRPQGAEHTETARYPLG